MREYSICRNNDKEKQILGQSPASCNPPDDQRKGRNLGDLCKGEHNYQQCQDRQVGQVYGGEDAKLHVASSDDSNQQEVCHMPHTNHLESPTLHQVSTPKILPELPLPSEEFCWYAPEIDIFTLYYCNSYTGILIQALHTGSYLIIIDEHSLIEVPTLRQAQAICHTIAWVFKDSLPVPKRLINTNATEPNP